MKASRLGALCLLAVGLVTALAVGCTGGGPEREPEEATTVYAAASLADVLEEQAEVFRGRHPDAWIDFNFGGSNLLAQQIVHGAPADLFIAADRRQVELLVEEGRVRPETVVPLLGNRLVVVVPAGDTVAGDTVAGDTVTLDAPRGLLAYRRLAIADPQAVPAGGYARQWLQGEGLWDELEARVVPALDVRAALAAVASGNLPAGIVYATDAATSDAVAVAYEVPDGAGPGIRYHAAPVAPPGGGADHAAGPFLAFLRSPAAAEVFRRHGFQPLGAGAVE